MEIKEEKGQYGLEHEGQILIPCEYEFIDIQPFNVGDKRIVRPNPFYYQKYYNAIAKKYNKYCKENFIAMVKKNNKYGVFGVHLIEDNSMLSYSASEILACEYDNISYVEQGYEIPYCLMKLTQNGGVGLFEVYKEVENLNEPSGDTITFYPYIVSNVIGKILIPCGKYDDIERIRCGWYREVNEINGDEFIKTKRGDYVGLYSVWHESEILSCDCYLVEEFTWNTWDYHLEDEYSPINRRGSEDEALWIFKKKDRVGIVRGSGNMLVESIYNWDEEYLKMIFSASNHPDLGFDWACSHFRFYDEALEDHDKWVKKYKLLPKEK